jgi:non-ribosomal peptide synthetase-like protein
LENQNRPSPRAVEDRTRPRRRPIGGETDPLARLHHYFEASCDAEPGGTALEVEGVALSYAELDGRANRLAHCLRALGIAPGSRVGILLPRSVDTYVTLLAVLKAGATFVPIDPSSPRDRVGYITDDAGVDLVVTTGALSGLTEGSPYLVVLVDELTSTLASMPATRPEIASDGDPVAYIIYTSGSSGRPKGVEVAQSSVCNFINVVPPLYRVTESDRVYQGMTIAFDFSIEEIWPTWAVGATVVAGPNDGRRLGPELAEFLQEHRITVMYCVPTVLATIDRDLPLLHTLNVGGEACPQELVDRWCTGDRVMLNTYGPTEATVTCIMATLEPGRPVAIGHPLPTYEAFLLDEDLRLVPDGEVGEICIGGPGVAKGYVGRPELTAERFVVNPFATSGRLYRTGDLGRWTAHGIEYRGRADSEVKVRGHRIDLREIESVLRLDDAVADAVVTVTEPIDELAAFVTAGPEGADDQLVGRLHAQLLQTVPSYMVPAYLTVVEAFPMLPSGKVDRKSLPSPEGSRFVTTTGPHTDPTTPRERMLCKVWAEVLRLDVDRISTDADFFVDLGGHSLAAATVVSTLRRKHGFGRLAIRDLYANPTVSQLAAVLDASGAAPARNAPTRTRQQGRRVAAAGTKQLGMLYVLLLTFSLPIALIYSANAGVPSVAMGVQLITLLPATYFLGRWLLPVALVRLLSARLTPGTFPLWGAVHLRVWAIQKLLELSPTTVLSGSPLLSPYLRLLGAHIGHDCHLASGEVGVPRFLDLRHRASVGYGAQLQTTVIEGDELRIGLVVLEDDAFVGASSMVLPGTRIGRSAALGEHSVLGPDQRIPAGERWVGSPSAATPALSPDFEAMASTPPPTRGWSRPLVAGFGVGLVTLEALPILCTAPVVLLVWWALLQHGVLAGLVAAALSGPVYVVSVCLAIASLRLVVQRRTATGILPLRSGLGLRTWFVDKLLEASLLLTNSLYATLYTVPWLRALGAKIGKGSEVSTVGSVSPGLLVLHPQSFVADMAQVGSATHHNGLVALHTTEVGRRAFVGNASFIPAGTSLADDSLVGVHTVPPSDGVTAGSSWLGSPAMFLPRRQESEAFDEKLTFRPGRRKLVGRLAIELLRVTLPDSVLAAAVYLALLAVSFVAERAAAWAVVVATPAILLASGLGVVLLVALCKWAVVGAYRPRVEPLWSTFVRRSELVTGMYEAAAVPALLQALSGTPMLGPLLRLFGTRVGRRSLIETTHLTEFDLVRIGDDTVIGAGASLQTHLFEDRVMKMSVLTIETGATVGPRTVVLYDSLVGQDCVVGALSLVMKGESLMPGTRWAGIPAAFEVGRGAVR